VEGEKGKVQRRLEREVESDVGKGREKKWKEERHHDNHNEK